MIAVAYADGSSVQVLTNHPDSVWRRQDEEPEAVRSGRVDSVNGGLHGGLHSGLHSGLHGGLHGGAFRTSEHGVVRCDRTGTRAGRNASGSASGGTGCAVSRRAAGGGAVARGESAWLD